MDLSQFPAHVQKAIQDHFLEKEASIRVERGVEWLNGNAPSDWRLQLMSIYNGRVSSHVRTSRNDENALALAFRRVKIFQSADGRVTYTTIRATGIVEDIEAIRCGFKEKSHCFPSESVIINEDIDAQLLDDAWAAVLGEYRGGYQPVSPYPENIEQAYLLLGVVKRFSKIPRRNEGAFVPIIDR